MGAPEQPVKDQAQATAATSAGVFAGVAALIAQWLFARELLVACHGNEITIGCVLAVWLLSVGAGAWLAQPLATRLAVKPLRAGLGAAWLALAGLLPLAIWTARWLRVLCGVAPGEAASLPAACAGAVLVCAPVALVVGLTFPLLCRLAVAAAPSAAGPWSAAVGRLYAAEAAGYLAGGLLATFGLAPRGTTAQSALAGAAAAVAVAACLLPTRAARRLVPLAALAVLALACWHNPVADRLEREFVTARWRAFGLLPAASAAATPAGVATPRLVAARETRYQNLTVLELDGQYTLFGNGQVVFSFPDPLAEELRVHALLAQHPRARRVLWLGGNPLGDMAEVLKHPVARVVCVDLDPGVREIMAHLQPALYAGLRADPRLAWVAADGPRFVACCRETFDLIVVQAPPPVTAAGGRFHTLEFHRALQRRLAPDGVLTTVVPTSDQLAGVSAWTGAAVYRTLLSLYPVVLATGGGPTRFLAGYAGSPLTLDRAVLRERARTAAVPVRHFRPEYFLGADAFAPEEAERVRRCLAEAPAMRNTVWRPAGTCYGLLQALEVSEGPVPGAWLALVSLPVWLPAGVALALVGLAAAFAQWSGVRRSGRARQRAGLLLLVGLAGFHGLALEMLLVYALQGVSGVVYARLGLLVAAQMLGLTLGGTGGRWLAAGVARPGVWVRAAVAGLLVVDGGVAALPVLAAQVAGGGGTGWLEGLLYVLAVGVGACVGLLFPLVNRLYVEARGMPTVAAARTSACDQAGAAAGALLAGIFLAPVWGTTGAALCLAVLAFGMLGSTLTPDP